MRVTLVVAQQERDEVVELLRALKHSAQLAPTQSWIDQIDRCLARLRIGGATCHVCAGKGTIMRVVPGPVEIPCQACRREEYNAFFASETR